MGGGQEHIRDGTYFGNPLQRFKCEKCGEGFVYFDKKDRVDKCPKCGHIPTVNIVWRCCGYKQEVLKTELKNLPENCPACQITPDEFHKLT